MVEVTGRPGSVDEETSTTNAVLADLEDFAETGRFLVALTERLEHRRIAQRELLHGL